MICWAINFYKLFLQWQIYFNLLKSGGFAVNNEHVNVCVIVLFFFCYTTLPIQGQIDWYQS